MEDYVRKITNIEIKKANEAGRVEAVRIYRESPRSWQLQVRGQMTTQNGKKGSSYILAIAHLTVQDLVFLRDAAADLLDTNQR